MRRLKNNTHLAKLVRKIRRALKTSGFKEAVDPEDRKLRLKKVLDYTRRNKGAYAMQSTSNPHAKVHYFIRFRQGEQTLSSHKLGVSPKARRITGGPVRKARMELRKLQKAASDKATAGNYAIVPHAALDLSKSKAWKMRQSTINGGKQ